MIRVLFLFGLLVAAATAVADEPPPLAPGDPFPPATLEDQHGEPRTAGPGLRQVLFSRDMDGGGVAKEALAEGGAALLERADAVYVADIARMPALVTKLFALPGMRRRPYAMLLDFDGQATARWPSEPGRATLIGLRDAQVASVDTFDDPAALRAALEASAAPLSVEEEIVRLEERRYRALIAADASALDRLLDGDLVYTHSNGLVQGKAALIGSLADGTLDYQDVESRIEGLSIVGEAGEVVVVSGRAAIGATAAGRDLHLMVRYTAVYARRSGSWRLVAYQSTAVDEP